MAEQSTSAAESGGRRVRGGNVDVGAGLFLFTIGAVAFLGSLGLTFVQASGVGPGLMPRVTALIVMAFGLLFIVQGVTSLGDRLDGWSLRGIVFLLGAVVFFAAAVRPLGLVIAGPAAVIISSLADRQTRLGEIVPYALILTAACVVLFKYLLRQPIPLAPFVLGY